MKRPKVKGNCENYIKDLNTYIDHLESKIEIMDKGVEEIENLAAFRELWAMFKDISLDDTIDKLIK